MKKNEKGTIKDLAGLVCETLAKAGIDAVLVGGACVAIYSDGKYVSADLDFVTDEKMEAVRKALEPIGFKKTPGRHFEKSGCALVLEFLPYPVAIGKEVPVRKFGVIKTTAGRIKILTRTDCIKDRLAAFFHWKDRQSLQQAVLVAKSGIFDLKEVERWSKHEGHLEKLREFIMELGKK